jgi:hypothetical protein
MPQAKITPEAIVLAVVVVLRRLRGWWICQDGRGKAVGERSLVPASRETADDDDADDDEDDWEMTLDEYPRN